MSKRKIFRSELGAGLICMAVFAAGCGAKEDPKPTAADIQANITRLQNDPNIPDVAKGQAIRQQQQLQEQIKKQGR